ISDGESFRILIQVYEPLVRLKPGSASEIEGALAESWEGDPAGTVYTFHLRKNVKFQDGTDFNAAAVVTNFDRWKNLPKEMQGDAYYYGAVMGGFGDNSIISKAEAVDDSTVKITLKQPQPVFLTALTLTTFSIVSPKVLTDMNASDPTKSKFGTDPSLGGTGAFKLTGYVPDDSATLERNDSYWGTKALLDKVIIKPISDPTARLQALQSGSIQGYDLVAPRDVKTITDNADLQLVKRPSFNVGYLGLQVSKPPVNDLKVRQAIAHAIDKQAIVDTIYAGLAKPAKEFIAPSSQFYDDSIQDYAYDPNKAKSLLQEAGYSDTNKPTVEFWYPTNVTRPYMPDPKGLFEAITQQLRAVGFNVKPNSADWSTVYLKNESSGNYQLYLLGWTGDYDDPSDWYGVFFGFQGNTPNLEHGFNPPGFKAALDKANGTLQTDARKTAYQEVYKIVHDQVGSVPLVHADTALAFTKAVQGYQVNPTGSERFDTIYLTK
ncbi:MAG TPA: ABC transporter substrate-binding protein, partial [Burkholderiaceae bacterium]